MSIKRTIDVQENFAVMLEKLHYEYNTMKENVTFLIDQHKDDSSFIDSPLFEKYHDREIAKKLEYESMKQELVDTYVPEDVKNRQYSWQMDFANKQLVIEVF